MMIILVFFRKEVKEVFKSWCIFFCLSHDFSWCQDNKKEHKGPTLFHHYHLVLLPVHPLARHSIYISFLPSHLLVILSLTDVLLSVSCFFFMDCMPWFSSGIWFFLPSDSVFFSSHASCFFLKHIFNDLDCVILLLDSLEYVFVWSVLLKFLLPSLVLLFFSLWEEDKK